MTAFQVKARHVGSNNPRVWASYDNIFEAEKHAGSINNKPFTSYYAWVEMIVCEPARHSFIEA